MKKLLKTLVIIKTKFYNYAKQYIIGKEFDAMTIIDNRWITYAPTKNDRVFE